MSIDQTTEYEMRPLRFGIRHSDKHRDISQACGVSLWAIGLPDEREVFIFADRIEINPAGALIAWTETRAVKWDDHFVSEREPEENPYPTLILAPGAWCNCYMASGWMGEPLSISALAEPDDA